MPRRVSLEDPLLDFPSEATAMPAGPLAAPPQWALTSTPTHAIDTTSRVVSFVLGFALASVIAWLGSIPGDDIAATPVQEPVARVVRPVVTADTEVTPPATTRPLAPPAIAAPAAASVATAAAAESMIAANRPTGPANAPAQPRTRQAGASGYRGALALSSSPEGAQVLLNGRVVGETPVVLSDLPVGSRALVVRRDGYSPWSASVRVVANQRTNVRATLTPVARVGG